MEFDSFNNILDFAIQREQEAHDFYMNLAKKVSRPYMKKVFEDFAREEAGHKAKLIGIKSGKINPPAIRKVADLQIGDYLEDTVVGENIDYLSALILAMKREKIAFKLYSNIAAKVDDETLKNTFLMLAQEEARHKLRFEIEYDEAIMTEN